MSIKLLKQIVRQAHQIALINDQETSNSVIKNWQTQMIINNLNQQLEKIPDDKIIKLLKIITIEKSCSQDIVQLLIHRFRSWSWHQVSQLCEDSHISLKIKQQICADKQDRLSRMLTKSLLMLIPRDKLQFNEFEQMVAQIILERLQRMSKQKPALGKIKQFAKKNQIHQVFEFALEQL